jgi:hypothetical protein
MTSAPPRHLSEHSKVLSLFGPGDRSCAAFGRRRTVAQALPPWLRTSRGFFSASPPQALSPRSSAFSRDPHPPPPPWIIPDWRRFGRGHPRPSQPGPVHARFSRGWAEIGVDFSHQALIGVGLESFDFPISAFACDVGGHGDSIPSPRLRELVFFWLEASG